MNKKNSVFIKLFVILLVFAVNILTALSAELNIEWKNIGPGGGGTMYSPAISPLNPDLMFISCDMSGVYRSSNGGRTWKMINYHQLNSSISCPPVFHPSNPNIIWDESGNSLLQSTDAGITWKSVWQAPGSIVALACMSTEPLCLLVSVSGSGLYVSYDGVSFSNTNAGVAQSLSEDGKTIAIITGNQLLCSYDRGKKFIQYFMFASTIKDIAIVDSTIYFFQYNNLIKISNNGASLKVLLSSDSLKRGDFQFVRAKGKYVWVTTGNSNTTYQPTVYFSSDSGNSFKPVFFCSSNSGDTPNSIPDWISLEFSCWWGGAAQGFCISATNPGLAIWTDMGRSFITSDTGKTWNPDFTTYEDTGTRTAGKKWNTTGIDITTNWDIYMSPENANYYQIAYTDIGGSVSEDGGNSWKTTYNTGIPNKWFNTNYNFAYDKDTKLLWGAFSAKHDISSWNGAGWNPGSYNLGGICFSTNEGRSWTPLDNGGLPDKPVTSLSIDYTSPADSRRIYASVFTSGIWKTENGGKSWTRCANGLDVGDETSSVDGPNNHITEVQVFGNGDVFAMKSIYFRQVTAKNDAGLWKSTDHGDSWNFISSNVPGCDPQSGIDTKQEHSWAYSTTFLVDEDNENIIYAGAQMCNHGKAQGGLYKTTDGGATWSKILQIYGANRLTKSKYYPGRYYLATCGNGLMYTDDSMNSWHEDSLIPFSYLTRVTEDLHDSSVIWVNTFGGSVWKGSIGGETGVNDIGKGKSGLLSISPNPASDYIIITAPSDAHTLKGVVENVRFYDIFGQDVSDALHLEGGAHLSPNVRIDVSDLPAGVYFVRVGEKVNKFVKM